MVSQSRESRSISARPYLEGAVDHEELGAVLHLSAAADARRVHELIDAAVLLQLRVERVPRRACHVRHDRARLFVVV